MEKYKDYKITIFGDSIPKGIVFEDNQLRKLPISAVDLIADKLNLTINNLSAYGQTLTRLEEKDMIDTYLKSIDPNQINVAVIALGGNDSDFDWKSVANSPYSTHISKTPPKDFETRLNSIICRLQGNNIKVILTNLPPVCSHKYFNNVISKISNSERILEFLHGDIDNIYRHQELYNNIITRCAINNHCRLLDVREGFLNNISYLNTFCEDGIHPNRIGHEQMANSVLNQLIVQN